MVEVVDVVIEEISADSFQVKGLIIKDQELKAFLDEHDPQTQSELCGKAVKLGLIVLRDMQTTDKIDYIEKSFNTIENRMKADITTFEENIEEIKKDISKSLDAVLGEKSELAKKLDPEHKSSLISYIESTLLSPDSKLLTAIRELQIQQHQEQVNLVQNSLATISKHIGIQEEAERSTHKGFTFEEEVHQELLHIAKFYGDKITNVSIDRSGSSQKGDFLIELNMPNRPRVIVEAKDHKKLSYRKLTTSYMPEALENYEAELGIVVSKRADSYGKKRGAFTEDDKLLLCIYDGEEPLPLELAYKWARIKLSFSSTDTSFDKANIQKLSKKVLDEISVFTSIKGEITGMQNTCDGIKSSLDTIRDSIKDKVKEIEEILVF